MPRGGHNKKPDSARASGRTYSGEPKPKRGPAPLHLRCEFWSAAWCGRDGMGCELEAVVELDDGHGSKARCCAYHQMLIKIQPAETAQGLGLIWDGYPEGEHDDDE